MAEHDPAAVLPAENARLIDLLDAHSLAQAAARALIPSLNAGAITAFYH